MYKEASLPYTLCFAFYSADKNYYFWKLYRTLIELSQKQKHDSKLWPDHWHIHYVTTAHANYIVLPWKQSMPPTAQELFVDGADTIEVYAQSVTETLARLNRPLRALHAAA